VQYDLIFVESIMMGPISQPVCSSHGGFLLRDQVC